LTAVAIRATRLFDGIPSGLQGELTDVLAHNANVRVERIVSRGHVSPPGFWYDQAETEWVVVVKGRARVRFESEAAPLELGPGDHITIPPHARHRVEWTAPDEDTVWIAVFF
jgi:cupin 2 domain-containing protein